jgi:positive regulator of sigma E activity
MPELSYMEKSGLVTQVHDDQVSVLLTDASGCGTCHNHLCLLAEAKSRYVTVKREHNHLKVGDEVVVRVKPSTAYAAAFWLYGMPFLLMMLTIFGFSMLGFQEAIAGLSGLLILVPYYSGLFLVRRQLAQPCTLDISLR